MRKLNLSLLAFLLGAAPVWAGPHAGGTLVVHDANLLMSETDGSQSPCVQGLVPLTCDEADGRIDGGIDKRLIRVYAAFAEGALPRLIGMSWALDYDDATIFLNPYRKCGNLEWLEAGWPHPNSGAVISWDTPQTDLMVPVYWFCAYTYGAAGTLDAIPHPTMGGYFVDDYYFWDPIAGYSRLGFDTEGEIACPTAPMGACCDPMTAECTLTTPTACSPPSHFLYDESSCDPDPCPYFQSACCLGEICSMLTAPECADLGGLFQGLEVECPPNSSCLGACCQPLTGGCTVVLEADCGPDHFWQGMGTDCDPNPCQPTPAEATSWGRIKAQYRERK